MPEPLKFKTTPKDKPIPFEVDGERFAIWPIQGWSFLRFARAVVDSDDSPAAEAEQAVMVHRLFEDHMDPEEFERWEKFAISRRGPTLEELVRIANGLVEASSDRPTEPPSSSRGGRSSTSDTSTDDASSEDSTSES